MQNAVPCSKSQEHASSNGGDGTNDDGVLHNPLCTPSDKADINRRAYVLIASGASDHQGEGGDPRWQ